MKSLTLNETLSIDSTLESPTKPHSDKPSTTHKKLFLVEVLDPPQLPENIPSAPLSEIKRAEDKNSKKIFKHRKKHKSINKVNIKKKNNINNKKAVLDFDAILKCVLDFRKKEAEKQLSIKKKKSMSLNKKVKTVIPPKTKPRKESVKSNKNIIIINKSDLLIDYNTLVKTSLESKIQKNSLIGKKRKRISTNFIKRKPCQKRLLVKPNKKQNSKSK